MWNRRYLPVVVLLFIVGIVFFQPRSQGFEYTVKPLFCPCPCILRCDREG